MKKLSLRLDDLAVESFITTAGEVACGTVKGHETAGPYTCAWTCGVSCPDTCQWGNNCQVSGGAVTCGARTCLVGAGCDGWTDTPDATCVTYPLNTVCGGSGRVTCNPGDATCGANTA